MLLMNWKNNTLVRISIEITCLLFSEKGKSTQEKKKRKENISPPPNIPTKLQGVAILLLDLSPSCLTVCVYVMYVSVRLSECLSLPPSQDHSTRRCYVTELLYSNFDNRVKPAVQAVQRGRFYILSARSGWVRNTILQRGQCSLVPSDRH